MQDDGDSAVVLAVKNSRVDVADYLISKVHKHTVPWLPLSSPLTHSLTHTLPPTHAPAHQSATLNFFGRTLLHEAAQRGMTSTCLALVASNVPVNETDDNQRTALHEAAAGGFTSTMTALLDRGADINVQDKEGHTPLHMCAAAGFVDAVKKLVSCNADASVVNNDNKTAWRLALTNHHNEYVVPGGA